jgi:hypothetical protein
MYADVFGKKKKFGMKLSAGYMFGKDWEATTTETNSYLPVSSPPQNLNAKVAGWSNNADADYGDFNTYTQTNANAKPNSTPPGTSFVLKPFAENDMWNRNVNSLKINSLFAYRFTDEVQLSYQFRLARATSVYQGNNRAALKDFLFISTNWNCCTTTIRIIRFYSAFTPTWKMQATPMTWCSRALIWDWARWVV